MREDVGKVAVVVCAPKESLANEQRYPTRSCRVLLSLHAQVRTAGLPSGLGCQPTLGAALVVQQFRQPRFICLGARLPRTVIASVATSFSPRVSHTAAAVSFTTHARPISTFGTCTGSKHQVHT